MRNSNRYRKIEAVCGLITTLLGLVTLGYVLFGPLYSYASSNGEYGTENMIAAGIQSQGIVFLSLLFLATIGVGVGAVLHSRTQRKVWRVVLGFSAGIIVIGTLLGLASIGFFLFPCTFFAVITLMASSPKYHTRGVTAA
jgi:hypothetical protein